MWTKTCKPFTEQSHTSLELISVIRRNHKLNCVYSSALSLVLRCQPAVIDGTHPASRARGPCPVISHLTGMMFSPAPPLRDPGAEMMYSVWPLPQLFVCGVWELKAFARLVHYMILLDERGSGYCKWWWREGEGGRWRAPVFPTADTQRSLRLQMPLQNTRRCLLCELPLLS